MAKSFASGAQPAFVAGAPSRTSRLVLEAKWLVFAALALYLLLILLTYSKTDPGWSNEASRALLASTPANARIVDLPLSAIRRPLAGSRADDELKVEALAASIAECGQREPIDVLECPPGSGKYFGFSGCHRFAAMKKLGRETIRCRVRGVSEATLRMHLA